MTDEQLAAIRARCDAATPGPFDTYVHGDNAGYTVAKFGDNGQDEFWTFSNEEDAQFFSHAHEDVPALLDEVARLQAEVRELERALHPPCTCSRCTGLPDYYELEEGDGDA